MHLCTAASHARRCEQKGKPLSLLYGSYPSPMTVAFETFSRWDWVPRPSDNLSFGRTKWCMWRKLIHLRSGCPGERSIIDMSESASPLCTVGRVTKSDLAVRIFRHTSPLCTVNWRPSMFLASPSCFGLNGNLEQHNITIDDVLAVWRQGQFTVDKIRCVCEGVCECVCVHGCVHVCLCVCVCVCVCVCSL